MEMSLTAANAQHSQWIGSNVKINKLIIQLHLTLIFDKYRNLYLTDVVTAILFFVLYSVGVVQRTNHPLRIQYLWSLFSIIYNSVTSIQRRLNIRYC